MVYFELAKSFDGDGCVRVVRDAKYKKDIKNFVKENSHENIYMSVYTFTEYSLNEHRPVYNTAVVDKFFIEIDSEGHNLVTRQTWEQVRMLIDWCREESLPNREIKPQIFFSGRSGYHILFHFLTPVKGMKNKNVLQTLVKGFKRKTGVDVDLAANNGFGQMRRIPNTKNHKSGYYCIPLTVDEAYNYPPSKILELASKPRNIDNFDGYSPYFYEVVDYINKQMKEEVQYIHRVIKLENNNNHYMDIHGLDKIRPCLQKCINQLAPSFQERTWIASEMIHKGYSDKDIHGIYRNFTKYEYGKTQHHLNLLRSKGLFPPSCSTLQMHGVCTHAIHQADNEQRAHQRRLDSEK